MKTLLKKTQPNPTKPYPSTYNLVDPYKRYQTPFRTHETHLQQEFWQSISLREEWRRERWEEFAEFAEATAASVVGHQALGKSW